MRGRATWLVVGAVAALALAAALDAFWPRSGPRLPPPAEAPTEVEPDPTEDDLARAGAGGLLFLTIRAGAGCEYRTVAIPQLDVVSSGRLATCRFQVSPDAEHIAELWECPARSSRVLVVSNPVTVHPFVGCAAAWKPDGAFTYLTRTAAVVEAAGPPCLRAPACLRTLVPWQAVARGIRRLDAGLGPEAASQIEWLTPARLAVVVRRRGNAESIVLFRGRRPLHSLDFPFAPHVHVEVDETRRELLVGGRGGGFAAFNFNGGFTSAARVPFADAAAVAVSPDGRFLALARPGNVCIYERESAGAALSCIPGDAQDLAWR
jgi:hypothetical protein